MDGLQCSINCPEITWGSTGEDQMILARSNRYPIVTALLLLCAVSRFRHMFHLGCAGMSASIFHGLKTTGFGIPTYFETFRSFG